MRLATASPQNNFHQRSRSAINSPGVLKVAVIISGGQFKRSANVPSAYQRKISAGEVFCQLSTNMANSLSWYG